MTSTLGINFQNLRHIGVEGKCVEFFGPGLACLSISDRVTISNMCPEYGAIVGFFPVDKWTLAYLQQTGVFLLFVCVFLVMRSVFPGRQVDPSLPTKDRCLPVVCLCILGDEICVSWSTSGPYLAYNRPVSSCCLFVYSW